MKRLENHQHIAYDLDGTLFGPKQQLLKDFIISNPDKTHSILTSRQSSMENFSIQTLRQIFQTDPRTIFKHIIHSPSATLEGHQVEQHFKGKRCAEIGATALVDDWPYHEAGCRVHGIEFVDVHSLS